MPATPAKSKSKRPATEDDEDPDVEDTAPAKQKNALVQPKKKSKAAKEPSSPEPVEPEESEPEDADPEEAAAAARAMSKEEKRTLSKRRRKAKLVAYRQLSKTAGYLNVNADGHELLPMRNDCLASLLSEADAKRLMRCVPTTPGAVGFASTEFNKRMALFKHGVPSTAARVTQAECDALMRGAMNKAVMRALESGKKTVTASVMASVLREYAANMEFTSFVPPIGLVRYGQDIGVLNTADENDAKKRAEEKKEANANKKAFLEHTEMVEKKKAAKKAAKEKARTEAQAELVAS